MSRRDTEEAEAQSLLIASPRHPDQGGSAAAEIPERYPGIPTSRNSGTLFPRLSGECGRAVGAALPAFSGRGVSTKRPLADARGGGDGVCLCARKSWRIDENR